MKGPKEQVAAAQHVRAGAVLSHVYAGACRSGLQCALPRPETSCSGCLAQHHSFFLFLTASFFQLSSLGSPCWPQADCVDAHRCCPERKLPLMGLLGPKTGSKVSE